MSKKFYSSLYLIIFLLVAFYTTYICHFYIIKSFNYCIFILIFRLNNINDTNMQFNTCIIYKIIRKFIKIFRKTIETFYLDCIKTIILLIVLTAKINNKHLFPKYSNQILKIFVIEMYMLLFRIINYYVMQ